MKNKIQRYSKGVFLNTTPRNREHWKNQADFINALPGVEHVEVWIEENLSSSEIKFLRSLLKRYKIIVHAPFIELNFISCHPEIREAAMKLCLRAIQTAKKLGAEVITLHAGKMNIFQSKEAVIKLLVPNLKEIKKHTGEKPLITIENMPPSEGVFNSFLSALEDFSYLKMAFPEVYFTFDVGHAFQSGENLDKIYRFLRQYKNSILDIHLHDATLKGRAHLALGKGELNIRNFFRLLKSINYGGYVSLETITRGDTHKSWRKIYKL